MHHVQRILISVIALSALGMAIGAAGALAHPGHKHAPFFGMAAAQPDPKGYAGLVSNPKGKCGPLYEIKSKDKNGNERISCTHGPDAAPPGAPTSDDLRSVDDLRTNSARAPETAKSVACDGANSNGMRVVAIYAYSAGQTNRSAAMIPLIREWASQVDDVYYESARETSGSRSVRWLTEPSSGGACQIKVETLALTATGDDNFGNTLNESHAAGNVAYDRRYVIWMDGTNPSGICGIGEFWPDDQPGPGNNNNGGVVTGYSGLTSRIDLNCWGNESQLVEAHELGHNLGAVQASAPNDSGGGHCIDEWDIMCYSDSPNFPAMTYVCGTLAGDSSHDNRLDCGHNDYYHTNPPVGNYLDTHWNVADNNFLREAGIVHDATLITATGDGDSVVEPGESFSFNERVENHAGATATAVSGTLSSPSANVTPAPGAKAYPNIAVEATGTNTTPYSATLSAAATCGDRVPLTVTITSSAGTHQVNASLPSGGPGAITSFTNSPNVAIPDNNPAGVNSSTVLAASGKIYDVNVTVNITHTYDDDVRATLTGPDGTSVLLFGGVGGMGDNFTNTVLDDEAITAITAGTAPFTGSFRPETALSAFDGKSIAGTWTLNVVDTFAQDTGTLSSWTVAAQGVTCSVAPPAAPPRPKSDGSVRGDFNGDGIGDLAVGAPGEDIGATVDAGVVHVMNGSAAGLTATGSQYWNQNSAGIADAVETGDGFGSTLSAGDFNGDGRDDLAIGVGSEDVGATVDAGVVHVLYGSAAGLTATGSQYWHQNATGLADAVETDDRFGSALANGKLNTDTFAELVVGVADEDVGTTVDAGVVQVIPGAAAGLTATGSQYWHQNVAGVDDAVEADDGFGGSLAVGDMNSAAGQDLAIGVAAEDIGASVDAGVVHVLYGSAAGLTATGTQYWHQNSVGIADAVETGDGFGSALAVGKLNSDAFAELVVGVADEDVGATVDAGVVQVIPGAAGGLTATGSQYWHQNVAGIDDAVETGDGFGGSLAIGDINSAVGQDLAIGAAAEDIGATVDAGVVHAIYGSAAGLTATGSQYWHQNSTGVADAIEAGDRFGSALAVGKLNNDAFAELIVGVPDEDVGPSVDAGVAQVLPGASAGLTATGSQYWHQNVAGIADAVEGDDGFGGSLGA